MNENEIRLTEECLYIRKYLYGRMQELAIIIEALMPQAPGSVLKMIGRPVAKTPIDTSETERWGIIRACCCEAEELSAKQELYNALQGVKNDLSWVERTLVRFLYDQELQPRTVKHKMGIDHKSYYMLRQKVLRTTWKRIRHIEKLDLAVQ